MYTLVILKEQERKVFPQEKTEDSTWEAVKVDQRKDEAVILWAGLLEEPGNLKAA